MAENVKRANLSVVEIAEFICRHIDSGEKQNFIAENLGNRQRPSFQICILDWNAGRNQGAVRSKKLGSIQAAHALFKVWEENPKETFEFIESKERISTAEAKNFDPKSGTYQLFLTKKIHQKLQLKSRKNRLQSLLIYL